MTSMRRSLQGCGWNERCNARSPPQRGIDRQTTAYARREVDETAVVTKRPVSEQPRQQGQGVLGEGRVDEWFLSLYQRFFLYV